MPSPYLVFNATSFAKICRKLAKKDTDLAHIIKQHGLPPMWTRPNTFQTLILTILEQQVSLASAYAAFKKLKEKIGVVTPSAGKRLFMQES
jgi:DNA-3-methyladenine glycosylase II